MLLRDQSRDEHFLGCNLPRRPPGGSSSQSGVTAIIEAPVLLRYATEVPNLNIGGYAGRLGRA